MKKAYAPYSKFHVGAAVLTKNGQGLFRLQRGERFLRDDELRGTHGHLFSRCPTRPAGWKSPQSQLPTITAFPAHHAERAGR